MVGILTGTLMQPGFAGMSLTCIKYGTGWQKTGIARVTFKNSAVYRRGRGQMQLLYISAPSIRVVNNPTKKLLVPAIRIAPLSYRLHEGFLMFAQTQHWVRQPFHVMDERVKAALRIVDTSFWRSNLNATEIAHRLAVSSSRLQHLVKRDTGSSLQSHVHAARIRRAALLLRQTTLLVKQVAAEAGYRSTSSLERHFQKFFACSPKVYRTTKQNRPAMPHTDEESQGSLEGIRGSDLAGSQLSKAGSLLK